MSAASALYMARRRFRHRSGTLAFGGFPREKDFALKSATSDSFPRDDRERADIQGVMRILTRRSCPDDKGHAENECVVAVRSQPDRVNSTPTLKELPGIISRTSALTNFTSS
jgi:hypothetical protein